MMRETAGHTAEASELRGLFCSLSFPVDYNFIRHLSCRELMKEGSHEEQTSETGHCVLMDRRDQSSPPSRESGFLSVTLGPQPHPWPSPRQL